LMTTVKHQEENGHHQQQQFHQQQVVDHIESMSDDDLAKSRVQFNSILWRKLSSTFMDWNHQFYEEGDEEQFEMLMYLISEYELTSNTKLQALTATTERDIELFQKHIQDLESTLQRQQAQLQYLHENLNREQIYLQQHKEYDALSGIILGYEDRQAQTEKYNHLRQELDQLEKENEQLVQLVELRHKQFALLMHTIDELESTLQENSAQKEQEDQPYLAVKQSQQESIITPATPQQQSTSEQPETAPVEETTNEQPQITTTDTKSEATTTTAAAATTANDMVDEMEMGA